MWTQVYCEWGISGSLGSSVDVSLSSQNTTCKGAVEKGEQGPGAQVLFLFIHKGIRSVAER